ncbi:9471_t:CDS:2, partial [Funneliformis geosporum]
NAIKKLPIQGMQKFRQHSINVFNKYWEKFDPNIYILAYFLHPAFCVDPYDQEFDKQIETPMSWWLSIKDKYNHLCELAIMIFSITPHSVGCKKDGNV